MDVEAMSSPKDGERVLAWCYQWDDEVPSVMRHFDKSGWEIWDQASACFESAGAPRPHTWVPLDLARQAAAIRTATASVEAERDAARAEVAKLRELIGEVQFCVPDATDRPRTCPLCYCPCESGHATFCRLAAALAPSGGDVKAMREGEQ